MMTVDRLAMIVFRWGGNENWELDMVNIAEEREDLRAVTLHKI